MIKIAMISLAVVASLAATSPASAQSSWDKVAAALGKCGTEMPSGLYRVRLPRTDLYVTLGGVEIKPTLALGSWLAFKTMGTDAMVMGDLVPTAQDVNPVLCVLRDNGIEVTALHNHMLDDQPRLFFMHFWANDDAEKLAKGLRSALDKVNVARS
jgi:Domain of Unknown Function (DUF1259)